MRAIALVIAFLLLEVLSTKAEAVDQWKADQGRSLYLICASRGFDEGCTRSYSFAIKLIAAQKAYQTDRTNALNQLSEWRRAVVMSSGGDEKAYLQQMAS